MYVTVDLIYVAIGYLFVVASIVPVCVCVCVCVCVVVLVSFLVV